jgi:hypothetical protein
MRIPLTVLGSEIARFDGLHPLPRARAASLMFRTPVSVRSGGQLKADSSAILRSLILRVSGMARWQGISLAGDWPSLHRDVEVASIDDSQLVLALWRRYSLRRGGSAIPMAGWLGPLRMAGRLDRLAPFLAMAETCNTGSHASLGLGWFDLSIVA